MNSFRRRKCFRLLRRYLAILLALITVIIMTWEYYLTQFVESDSFHPLTTRWQSMNLHQIIRLEIDTAVIRPQIAANMCKNAESHPHLCIIIMVASAPANKDARKAIRETWANKSILPSDVAVLFILGRTLDEYTEKSMYEEARMHKDMVIEDFIDSYENLTLKSLFSLKWVLNHCEAATHLMKTDDDMLILVDNLWETLADINFKFNLEKPSFRRDDDIKELQSTNYIKTQSKFLTKQPLLSLDEMNGNAREEMTTSGAFILGYHYHKVKPVRDKNSKWFLPYTLYPEEYLPDFISGTAYVIATGNGFHGTIKSILMNSLSAKHALPLEDVFITGIIANQAMGISLLSGNKQFHKTIPLILPWSVSELATCFYQQSITIHGLEASEIRQGWKFITEINKEKCTSLKGYFFKSLYSILALFELSKPKS